MYETAILTIQLKDIKDIQIFITLAEQYQNGIIQLSQGNNVISGKSLMEYLACIDYNQPQLLIVQGENSKEFISLFQKWKVGKLDEQAN